MDSAETALRTLYPDIVPYRSGRMRVSELHEIYWEESGNPNGKPALFVHGGPGGGTDARQRRFFDPSAYRIILFDQRGCGKSTPHAELRENTTWDLVADVERLREFLKVERWLIFGGSWGSTLALAYAVTYPERVSELVLRGIFLLREKEVRWFYQEGASVLFPDAWEEFVRPIPETERHDLVGAYHRRLTGDDALERTRAAKAWSTWESRTSALEPNEALVARAADAQFALAFAGIECHYFANKGFFERDGWLLGQVERIRHIPTVIVQGRYDVVCPMDSAWALHRAFPEAEFVIVANAGHAAAEPGTTDRLIEATDRFRTVMGTDGRA